MPTCSRLIALDTETTGLYPKHGDRLISIGCVEILANGEPGVTFHQLINPERPVSIGAQRVHGYSWEMLKSQPRFDIGFLNAELAHINRGSIADYCDDVIDTLSLARQKRPGKPASLDALCKAFRIDASARTLHGALIDSLLLVQVYNSLTKLP